MPDLHAAIRAQLGRQIAHWASASNRLQKPEDLASEAAWGYLERYLGVTIRRHLAASVEKLQRQGALLKTSFEAAESLADLMQVSRRLLDFRRRYLRTEVTLDFYSDAINTRTSAVVGAHLRACDSLGHRSMAVVLDQLGRRVPIVLTYLDKGIGASILKAGLRLWDGTESPVAAVKITRHNLLRPTSLIHEMGHQVAHLLGWNDELAAALSHLLARSPGDLADIWASWASEIAADAHAFVHTGYAAVAALHDVLAGEPSRVFQHLPGDPHPIGYLRVLLGVEMCRRFYGPGPWDDLAAAWISQSPGPSVPGKTGQLIQKSLPLLPQVVEITLATPMKAFAGRSLCSLVSPDRVKPSSLDAVERELGAALYTSSHWVWTECLRILALTGLKLAIRPENATETLLQQENWMLRLGGTAQAA